jgi:hypothetical protein
MDLFLSLVQENGLLGLATGLGVLLVVYGLSAGNVVVTQRQKQAANVVVSIVLAGLSLLNPTAPDGVVTAIASISSSLTYEFIRFIAAKAAAQKASKGAAAG